MLEKSNRASSRSHGGDVAAHRQSPAHGLLAAAGDDHRLTAKQVLEVAAVVPDRHLHALDDVVLVQPHPAHEVLHGGGGLVNHMGVDDIVAAFATTVVQVW